jgi:hypothetical protein
MNLTNDQDGGWLFDIILYVKVLYGKEIRVKESPGCCIATGALAWPEECAQLSARQPWYRR